MKLSFSFLFHVIESLDPKCAHVYRVCLFYSLHNYCKVIITICVFVEFSALNFLFFTSPGEIVSKKFITFYVYAGDKVEWNSLFVFCNMNLYVYGLTMLTNFSEILTNSCRHSSFVSKKTNSILYNHQKIKTTITNHLNLACDSYHCIIMSMAAVEFLNFDERMSG